MRTILTTSNIRCEAFKLLEVDAKRFEHPPKILVHERSEQISLRPARISNSNQSDMDRKGSRMESNNGNINLIYVERKMRKLNSDLVITVSISVCEKPVTLLVDSGAHACILAAKTIRSNVIYYPKNKYCLVGISGPNQSVKTLGATYGNVMMAGVKLNNEFQIAGDDVHLDHDGIIGLDLLLKYGAVIDCCMLKIKFMLPRSHELYELKERKTFEGEYGERISIVHSRNSVKYTEIENDPETKIATRSCKISNNTRMNEAIKSLRILRVNAKKPETMTSVRIEPNSYVDLFTKTNSDVICKAKHFKSGAFTVNSVVSKGINTVQVFNNSDRPIEMPIDELRVEYEQLNRYNVYSIKQKNRKSGSERIGHILDSLQTSHCSKEELKLIKQLVEEYSDVFHVEGDELTFANFAEHKITLKPGTNPIFTRQYKLPHRHKEVLEQKIREMLKDDVIEPSTSEWNSPLLLVPKKDAKDCNDFRVCVDFRKINKMTENQAFPMPDLDEELSKMHGAKVFSTLDIYSAFHQIQLREEDRVITAFTTSNKKYHFKRMPFGLKSSPITWQQYIVVVLSELLSRNNMAYMDDIMSYNANIEKHVENLKAVFERLRMHNLKLKLSKTKLFCKEIKYLGHIISADGVRADPGNVEAISKFPRPKKVDEVQRFVGMASYYRKYIKNFAKIAQPLHALFKKDIKFAWSENCEKALETLKGALISAPVLCFCDHSKTFYISVDASFYAVGAYISNERPPNDRPIEYFSKSLNHAQINYATTHKELLAIVLAIERFQHYIWGKHFVVYTDHEALTYLFNQSKPGSRLLRWKLLLSEYDFDIIHRPGKNNVVSDCLSRIVHETEEEKRVRFYHHVKNPVTRSMLNVITRSRAKENALLGAEYGERRQHTYNINEEPSITFNDKKYETIFFIFDDRKSRAFKKLELKIKRRISLNEAESFYSIIKIDETFNIILIPKILFDVDKMRMSLNEMFDICTNGCLNEIAVNLCLSNYKTYFEIKAEYRKIFHRCETSTTFFLNQQLEITDVDQINEILRTYHSSLLGGHRGFERMKNTLKKYYSWPSMNADIRKFITDCGICEKSKVNKHTHTPLQITSVASAPFEKIYIDFVGEIKPNSEQNHKYLLTISCDLSKYLLAVPTFDCTAITAARVIVDHVCLVFNIPKTIVSDNGPAFIAETFKQMAKLLDINHVKTTPYHPQSNGAIERYHRTIGEHLRAYTEENREFWHKYICYFLFSYNNTIHSTTGYAPHTLVFGFEIELPTKITNSRPNYNYETYEQELLFRLKNAQKRAKERIEKYKKDSKEKYDKIKNCEPLRLKRNDLVLLMVEKLPKNDKFERKYTGPYRVEGAISEAVTKIRIKNKGKIVHNDKLKLAKANYGNETPPLLE